MNIIQMVSNNASMSATEIINSRIHPDQPLFFQLYKRKDDKEATKRVREVEQLGYRAIFLTVDAPVAGSRERDIKAPFVLEEQEREAAAAVKDEVPQEAPREEDDADKMEEEISINVTAGALVASADRDMSWEHVGSSPFIDVNDLKVPIDHSLASQCDEVAHRYQRLTHATGSYYPVD